MAPSPHVTSDESGGPRIGGAGAVGAGRGGRGSGSLEIWNPENLRGRDGGRFSDFQDSRFSPPHLPAASPVARLVAATPTERGEKPGNLNI